MNEESCMTGQQTCHLKKIKFGSKHTKAPLAAALSPFMILLYPPKP